MGKKQVSVCEHCGKQGCSGKLYWAYDERNDKMHFICEDKTELQIHPDIYCKAVSLYENKYENAKYNDVSVTSKKYIINAAKSFGLSFIPVVRFYFIECGNFAIAMKKAWRHTQWQEYSGFELLSIPFSQLKDKTIYNNGCKRLKDVGNN